MTLPGPYSGVSAHALVGPRRRHLGRVASPGSLTLRLRQRQTLSLCQRLTLSLCQRLTLRLGHRRRLQKPKLKAKARLVICQRFVCSMAVCACTCKVVSSQAYPVPMSAIDKALPEFTAQIVADVLAGRMDSYDLTVIG